MKVLLLLSCVVVGGLAVSTIELLAGDPYDRYSTLLGYIRQVKLQDWMNRGVYTLFAPSNGSFINLQHSGNFNSSILTDNNRLKSMLQYHIANRSILTTSITNDMLVTMANGKQARFNVYSNGNGWTSQTINGRALSDPGTFDKLSSNGVVDMVHDVVPEPVGDIIGVLEADPILSTLLVLVRLAGMESVLKAERRTLFAPTNDAFKHLTNATMSRLSTDRNLLTDVIKAHVIGSTQYVQGFHVNGYNSHAPTLLQGEFITPFKTFSGLMLREGNIPVSIPDIPATNGVVHIIEGVLVPNKYTSVVG